MSQKLFIPVIAGATRPDRLSIHAAKFIFNKVVAHPELTSEFVDARDYKFDHDDNDKELRNPKYSDITARADGFIFVTPEYNHGYPGRLKTLFDSEWESYNDKPAVIAGVSDGNWGGVRMIEQWLQVLKAAKIFVINADIQFPRIQDLFDNEGTLLDPSYEQKVERSLTYLVWAAKTLKYGREHF